MDRALELRRSRDRLRMVESLVRSRFVVEAYELRNEVAKVLKSAAQSRQAKIETQQTQSFRPGRPTPTHRYAAAK